MRRKIVAGNWKMNTDRASGPALVEEILTRLGAGAPAADGLPAEVVLCPPFILLDAIRQRLGEGSAIGLGAQDVFYESSGAFTGAISAPMLVSVGCTHAIVGHSERRSIFRESDDDVARKTRAALAAGLTPIVCVGETLEERDASRVEEVVGRQLDAVLAVLDSAGDASGFVFAYEPVWAIGTGRTATPAQAQEVHAFIRARVASALGAATADALRLLYGGSVNAANAAELFACADIDGGLIGGASLKAADFAAIVSAAN